MAIMYSRKALIKKVVVPSRYTPTTYFQRIKRRVKYKKTEYLATIGAVLSIILTIYTLCKEFAPKEHQLSVYVAEINQNDNKLMFTVGYYNNGDYSETISNVKTTMVQKIKPNNQIPWEQGECNKPLLIEPKKTVFKTYSSTFNYNSTDLKSFPDQENDSYMLTLTFSTLSFEHGIVDSELEIGAISPFNIKNVASGANVTFVTNKINVNFNNAKPRITKLSYPLENKLLNQNICDSNT